MTILTKIKGLFKSTSDAEVIDSNATLALYIRLYEPTYKNYATLNKFVSKFLPSDERKKVSLKGLQMTAEILELKRLVEFLHLKIEDEKLAKFLEQ